MNHSPNGSSLTLEKQRTGGQSLNEQVAQRNSVVAVAARPPTFVCFADAIEHHLCALHTITELERRGSGPVPTVDQRTSTAADMASMTDPWGDPSGHRQQDSIQSSSDAVM